MAQLIRNGDYMTEGEKLSAEKLATDLPADWIVVTNKTLVSRNGVAREIDFIVVASNTVFVIDEKGFRGRIHGNDQYWVFDSRESCESPLNKIDVGARMLAGFLRDSVPQLRQEIGGKPFVVSAILLSDPTCELFIQEPRRDRIILLEDVSAALRKLDRNNTGSDIRTLRSEIVEKLRLVPPRPSLPRKINLYTVTEELAAGPYYRCFKATHSARSQSEHFRVKLYEVTMGSDAATREQRELINRDYRASARLADSGIASQLEIPMEWSDGRYVVVGQRIPALPTMRAAVLGGESLGFASTLKICQRMLEALAKMHELGVVHRNLNPDNTYVDPSKDFAVQFTDFDFSRIVNEHSVAALGDEVTSESRYAAPELESGLAQATDRSDIYSAGVILDELLSPHSVGDEGSDWQQLRDVIDSMIARDPSSRWSSAREAYDMLQGLFVSPAVTEPKTTATASELNSDLQSTGKNAGLLDGRYRVIRTLGEGATAVTYLAEDVEFEGLYVLKRIKDLTLAKRLATAEFKALRHLPEHPRIVKIIDAYPADRDFHLKMEYVEGESLQELQGSKAWDVFGVRRLVEQLLEGLAFLESHDKAHRDISPRNVILTEAGPKIIDFGFATTVDEVGQSNVGTVSFRAPELDFGESWNRTCDLYSVGAIGLWLLLGRLPFLRDMNGGVVKSELALPEESDSARSSLIKTLSKAVSKDRSERYESAIKFIEALRSSDAGTPDVLVGSRQVNPWVPQVQSLYRNSRVGNADNRGLDTKFARTTYVPTLLDTELLPQVLQGKFCVVLLSGNPGDGKTAFLEMVYDALATKPSFEERHKDENGWEVIVDGHCYQANYDASESHDGLRADELLSELFEPFQGDQPPPSGLRRTILVAINDGKMREFLLHKREYTWLGREVSWFTEERGAASKPERVVVVDLKQRSVVGDGSSADLFERVLDKLVSAPEWSVCATCRARGVCPIKFNRDSLSGRESGPRAQLRRLLQISHLRRDRHITIRDMRSTLSFILVGETSCEEIHSELEAESIASDWTERFYFSAAFNPAKVAEDNLTEFALCDPASSTHPRLERKLWHLHRTRETGSIEPWCTPISERSEEPILSIHRLATPMQWMNIVKRRLFFEGDRSVLASDSLKLPEPEALLPYRYLADYLEAVAGHSPISSLLPNVCEGISRANGISDDSVKGRFLCVRTSHSVEQDLTVFKRFPVEEFELKVKRIRSGFVESLPNSLALYHRESGAQLSINLDLFEILMRMNEGYLPGSEEQHPYLIDLDQFELRLLNEPADELLLLESGRRMHRVRQTEGTIEYLGVIGREVVQS